MQDRALRTRQTILRAAAKVFEERGYQAATIAEILAEAKVTKGALYFHFGSKEDLVDGVLAGQDAHLAVPERASKIQELVDTVLLQAHRLRTDQMVRAGARLTLDQRVAEAHRTGPFLRWIRVCEDLLAGAREQGELLPHVVPGETAALLVGTFAGVQSMSQTLTGYEDLMPRIVTLLRHVLPSVAISSVLACVDLSPERGAKVFEEITASQDSDRRRRNPGCEEPDRLSDLE